MFSKSFDQPLSTKGNAMKKVQIVSSFLAIALLASSAQAAGLDTGTAAINTFKTWFFVILAALSVIYLGAKGAQLATDKIQWADYGQCIMKTAVVGGSTAVAGWAFFLWAA
jgi:hypothetical protein